MKEKSNEDVEHLRRQWVSTFHRFGHFNMGVLFDDLSRREFMTLEVLRHHQGENGLSVSELAEELRVSSPAVSRMLRTLENKGFVERKVDGADRRNTWVYLTENGKNSCLDANQRMNDFFCGIVEEMGVEKMQQLFHLWLDLSDAIEKELETVKNRK